MKYVLPKELKSKTKVFKGLDLISFLIVVAWGSIGYLLCANTTLIYGKLTLPFNIFNIVMAIIMISPSPYNKGKKMYHSIIYLLLRDKYIYHSVNINKHIEIDSIRMSDFYVENIKKINEKNKEVLYKIALKEEKKEQFEKAMKDFNLLNDYKDSLEHHRICRDKYYEQRDTDNS